ncbi:MAG TPA: GNAT family N-acetyltransferase [Candidatus Acidoferrales bacterium]|nr:GNAT family N-acetyltransferase [Candidatus Acidoferrales bacterium]
MDHKLKISLARPSAQRRAEFLAAAARSRKLHGLWTSPPRSTKEFGQYVKRFHSPAHIGFWILTETNEIAGVANISEIVRGRFRSGYLGYYAFAPHTGRGYMTAGIRAVVTKAFRSLGLHRLEANIQPGNKSSRRLVQRLGFKLEGFSPRYLKIAGKWRDHERWAITAEDWKEFLRGQRSGKKKKS